ncbi:MAG TPA: alpha/beta fold hydrolase [Gammaproteobacteria bacterium]|nr:alpha/beta fold hydrolase [Gammaproteobacteria bacterium]
MDSFRQATALAIASVVIGLAGACTDASEGGPLVIASQGNRPFGGVVVGDPRSRAFACDHGYVDWQIPPDPREYPLLFVHASSKKTWASTFDGNREGFVPIFLRRGYATYSTDLPRTGQAGQACTPIRYDPAEQWSIQTSVTSWRYGRWLPGEAEPTFYPGVQFPTGDAKALDAFYRIQTPEFDAPENEEIETDALAILLGEIGPAVLVTHSSTGIRGWVTALKSDDLAAIVSYEPNDFVFPAGELPDPIPTASGGVQTPGREVPLERFLALTRMPIQIVWGDYIPRQLDPANVGPLGGLDSRRRNLLRAALMVEAINRHGGDAQNLVLPDIGITGNTHFPMLDLNNLEIADLLSAFLAEKGLDRR